MSIQNEERLLLEKLSSKHNSSIELIKKLLRVAEENNYSNKSMNERRTEYIDLIQFFSKKDGNNS